MMLRAEVTSMFVAGLVGRVRLCNGREIQRWSRQRGCFARMLPDTSLSQVLDSDIVYGKEDKEGCHVELGN